MRDQLQQKVKKELASLRNHLYQIAERTYKSIDKALNKIGEDVKKDPKNLEQYVQFVRSLKQASDTLTDCEEQKQKLEIMKMTLQKNRDKDAAQNTMGGMSHVQTLQQRIETISSDIDRLVEELKQANQRAEMNREANTNSLTTEISKQQA